MNVNFSAHQLGKAFANGEPEADALAFVMEKVVALKKAAKDIAVFLFGNAGPVVSDGNPGVRASPARRNCDRVGIAAVFECVF